MAKRPHSHDNHSYWQHDPQPQIPEPLNSKLPPTTRYTQPQNLFNLAPSFVLGKNDLLENNTSSELDSSDTESDVSFQQRLHCCHEKHLLYQINKYLQTKAQNQPLSSFDSETGTKSTEMMKDIEERVFDDIKRFHGNNQVEKIKLTLRFIKRNENLTRIYFEIVKSLPQNLQIAIFFLLKHSVIVYLQGRQAICDQENYISIGFIKEYLHKNMENICKEVIRDEKLQLLFNASQEQVLRKRFVEFLSEWFEGFFMAKEGYPCTSVCESQGEGNSRVGMREGGLERERRKKIKKF